MKRHHRYRTNANIRALLNETHLHTSNFILPLFVSEIVQQPQCISSLPGVSQHSVQSAVEEAKQAQELGLKAVILFGIPEKKDTHGSESYNDKGIVQQAIRAIKEACPQLVVIADCCLCEYTSHGHCGIMQDRGLDNDATLVQLQKVALSYAKAGVDIIAPSGMMDGMVHYIRGALDKEKFHHISIMSYAVKYASSFYGPFREAAGSDNFLDNRKHHQMNPAQLKEAFLEAAEDEAQGADFLMVKPITPYLDVLAKLEQQSNLPLVAYHVSGEYAMLKQAASAGLVNEEDAFYEVFTGIKRAGAQLIITYYAKEMATLLRRPHEF